jgi:hypothetical protein
MYEEPIHPRNLWLRDDPKHHADVDDIYRQNIQRLIDRGTFTAPAAQFPGATFQPSGEAPPAEEWERSKRLWDQWIEPEE